METKIKGDVIELFLTAAFKMNAFSALVWLKINSTFFMVNYKMQRCAKESVLLKWPPQSKI